VRGTITHTVSMRTPAKPLGPRIKALREARGWTQADLAARCLLSTVYVQKVELGERVPTVPTLTRIARALGASVVLDLRPPPRARRRR
jgi:transcriptional regulator with XRE-family HTH domain